MVKRALSFLINAKLQPKLQRFSRAARRIFKLSNKAAGAVPRDGTAEHLSCKERAFPKGPREGHTGQPAPCATSPESTHSEPVATHGWEGRAKDGILQCWRGKQVNSTVEE